MSDAKHEVSQAENGAPIKRSKKRVCVNHCKRFWWVHLIIFCCITVLVVCLVIFVGVPNIAQAKINDADLEVQSVNVLETQTNSYLMQINSTISTDGTVKADIDPFQGDMSLQDLPNAPAFATLKFPATNGDKHQEVNVSQTVQITDMDAFKKFNEVFFQNETLRVRIAGKTQVQPSGLTRKYDVDFVKILDLAGLNLLTGTKLTNAKIELGPYPTNKTNFWATAEIPNASHFTLDIGNATFANFADEKNVGNLTINDLVLRPGINSINVTGILDQATLTTIAIQKPYCQQGFVPIKLLGLTVENNGQNIPYFQAALASANQTVNVDILGIASSSLNTTFKCS